MKKEVKQRIALLVMLIFFSPCLFYVASKGPYLNDRDWLNLSLLYLFGYISFPVNRFFLGKEVFQKSAIWQEEGFSGFWEWIKKSKSFTARTFRWGNLVTIIVFIVSIIFGIIITLKK